MRKNILLFLAAAIILGIAIDLPAQVFNKIVAIVNDEVITQQDMDQLLGVLYAQYVQAYKGDELLKKMEEVKRDLLNQMIEDKLILSRAKELGIQVADKEVEERLQEIRNGFPTDSFFNNTLEAQGITVGDLKIRYRDQIMMKKVVNYEIKSKTDILPSEISEYYEKNREQFKRQEKYRVSHILIKAQSEVDFELAKVEIQDVYNKLVAGQDFKTLARIHSEGPNKEDGGDMGYASKGEMIEELDREIFSLKNGEFSNPIKTSVGYHIVKVDDIQHSGYMSLEEAQEDIKMMLYQQKLKEKVDRWLSGLRSQAYISIK
ncbi:MAG: peptidylprolyl isomerase [Candidatus Omnitrophota bacterium]